jgi:hypothetical protein
MKKTRRYDSEKFMALTETERQRLVARLERESPQCRLARSRPLNAGERKRWGKFQEKLGRPRIGRGSKAISLTLEKGLLEQADAFARRHGLSRSQLVAESLLDKIGRAA